MKIVRDRTTKRFLRAYDNDPIDGTWVIEPNEEVLDMPDTNLDEFEGLMLGQGWVNSDMYVEDTPAAGSVRAHSGGRFHVRGAPITPRPNTVEEALEAEFANKPDDATVTVSDIKNAIAKVKESNGRV